MPARSRLERFDRAVFSFATFVIRGALWPVLYAIGWGVFLARDENPWRTARSKAPELDALMPVLQSVLWAGLLMALAVTLFVLVRRRQAGVWDIGGSLHDFARLFSFSLAMPIWAELQRPFIESQQEIFTLFLIVLATLLVLPTVSYLWEVWHARRRSELDSRSTRARALAAAGVLLTLMTAYAAWFSRLSINTHHALKTRIFDLGIYDNIFYQSAHGNPLGSGFSSTGTHVTAHFDAILVLLAPLYHLYPRAELILVLQSVWCALGAIPVFLLGRHHLESIGAGLVFAAAWTLYPALHGPNLYDFHSLTLLATPMLWVMYLLQTGRTKALFVLLPFVLIIREDASLLLCFVGAAAILTGQPRLVRVGWVTILISIVYFLAVKVFIMSAAATDAAAALPSLETTRVDPLGGRHGYAWYYRKLIPKGGGLFNLIVALLTGPVTILNHALSEPKLIFLLQLLVPLAFLPLFAREWRFATVFGLLYLLLASRKAVYSIHFQYSIVLFPILFALAPLGLRALRDGGLPARFQMAPAQLVVTCLAAVISASVLMSAKFGAAMPNTAFKGGFSVVPRTLNEKQEETYASFRDLISVIPPDASVTAVGRSAPHVSNRAIVRRYREKVATEFVIIDKKLLRGASKKYHEKELASGVLDEVGSSGSFVLYRRVPGPPSVPRGEPKRSAKERADDEQSPQERNAHETAPPLDL